MGPSHEIGRARAEELPHFPPGQGRLCRLPFAVGKGELRVIPRLQGGVHVPRPSRNSYHCPAAKTRTVPPARNLPRPLARRRALLFSEMLRDLLPELLCGWLEPSRQARLDC